MKASTLRLDITANLLRWRAFVAVAEEGSLTRAALYLDTNQTALSRQLNALELECGVRLFTRTGRGVKASEAGQRLLPQVKDLLDRASQLEQDIRGCSDVLTGSLTVAMMPSLLSQVAGRLFGLLRQAHPQVHLNVLEGASGKVEEWLADGRADIGLLYRYSVPLPQGELGLLTSDACLVGPPGDHATANPTIEFKDLASVPLVLPSAPNGLRHLLDATARAAGVALRPQLECDSLLLLRSLAMHEGMNVILNPHAIREELATGKLQASRIVSPAVQATISLLRSRGKAGGRLSATVSDMIASLVEDAGRDWSVRPAGG